ncbi:MAG: hypothetical protein ACOWWR_07480 [Eubacteriales bacterium]
MDKKKNSLKIPYTGLGLVFSTAVGAGITLAIGQPIFWAGIGTGIGFVIGAAIDSMNKKIVFKSNLP